MYRSYSRSFGLSGVSPDAGVCRASARVGQGQAPVVEEEHGAAAAGAVPREELRQVRDGVEEQLGDAALVPDHLPAAVLPVRQEHRHVQVAARRRAAPRGRTAEEGTQGVRIARSDQP